MTDEAAATPENTVKLCPKGHPTRTLFKGQRCSSRKCGLDFLAELEEKKARVKADPSLKEILLPTPKSKLRKLKENETEEERAEKKAFEKRARLVKLPKGLKGEEAAKWAQDKLTALLPEAIASVAFDLRYGGNSQRAAATETILKANGLDRREAAPSNGGLIVLNLGQAAAGQVPWLQRMQQAVIPAQAEALKVEDDE
jgi:hypothetical protein